MLSKLPFFNTLKPTEVQFPVSVQMGNRSVTVTDDQLSDLPPEELKIAETYSKLAQNNPNKAIKELPAKIKEYPHIPQLKNYLAMAYQSTNQMDKVKELVLQMEKEHPDYLIGKINLAQIAFSKKKYNEIPVILGATLDLGNLCPDRDIFHLTEVKQYYKLVAKYFGMKENLDGLERCYNILKQVGYNEPEMNIYSMLIGTSKLQNIAKTIKKYEKKYPKLPLPEQKKAIPSLHHPELNVLFETGENTPNEIIQELLQLPRQTLVADLLTIMNDIKVRYKYFVKQFSDDDWDSDKCTFFGVAIQMLAELRAQEALPQVLQILNMNEDVEEFWFGDWNAHITYSPLYYLSKDNITLMRDTFIDAKVVLYGKVFIPEVWDMVIKYSPEKKQEITDAIAYIFDHSLATYQTTKIDGVILAYLVGTVIKLHTDELNDKIKQLYDLDIIDTSFCGTWNEVEQTIKKREEPRAFPIYSMFDNNNWKLGRDDDELDDDEFDDDYFEEVGQRPSPAKVEQVSKILNEGMPKVGRNDPCPCGSGQKYKKCHGK